MPGCSAIKCKNRSEDGFALFLITRTRRSDWLKVLGLPESTPLQFRICEVHFQADLFKLDKAGRLTLKPGAAPTLLGSNLQQQLQQVTVSTVTFSPLSEAVWGYSQGTASMKYIGAQAVLWKHVLKDARNNHQSSQARCAVGSVDEVKLMAEEKKLVNQNLSLLKENEKSRKEVKRLAAFK